MNMTGQHAFLSIPQEHVPGLLALVVTPLVLFVGYFIIRSGAKRGEPRAVRLDALISDLPFVAKAAVVAMIIGASVHAAIVPTHWTVDPALAVLFALDSVGLLAASFWTATSRRHWQLLAAVMLGSTVAGYAFYLGRGWETADPVGVATSIVELTGFFLVVLSGHSVFAGARRRGRLVGGSLGSAAAILFVTVAATGSTAVASAAPSHAAGAMGSMPTTSSKGIAEPSMPSMSGNSSTPTSMPSMGQGAAGAGGSPMTSMPPGSPVTQSSGAMPAMAGPPSSAPSGTMPAMSSSSGSASATSGNSGSSTGGMGSTGGAGASGGSLALATTSPAGNITWPLPMGSMEPGMQMVTPNCTAEPTTSQQRAAVALVNQTVASIAPYQSLTAAKAAGYIPITPSRMPVVHYANPAYLRSPQTLDPGAIEALVYANTSHGAVLAAAMYAMASNQVGQAPPMPGGCLTEWHVHTDLCFSTATGTVVGSNRSGACPAGSINHVTQPMIHVWLAPVPGGPLTVDATTAQIEAAATELPTPNPVNSAA